MEHDTHDGFPPDSHGYDFNQIATWVKHDDLNDYSSEHAKAIQEKEESHAKAIKEKEDLHAKAMQETGESHANAIKEKEEMYSKTRCYCY